MRRHLCSVLVLLLAGAAATLATQSRPVGAEIAPDADTTWGVTGLMPSDSNNFNSQVWDMQQVGNVMYVAGKFTTAISGPGGRSVPRPGLAAFNATTGNLIQSFDPEVIGGAVYALEVAPDGSRLFIAGEFTSVEGADQTAGLAAVDLGSGALDPTWRAGLERRWATNAPVARAIDVSDDHLYVGGNFSHIASGSSTKPAIGLGRVDLATGRADTNFTPTVSGGGVWDIDASPDGSRLYAVGFFTSVNGDSTYGDRFAALDTSDGSLVTGVEPFVPNLDQTGRQYAVVATDSLVFVGGEEHLLQVLNASDLSRRQVYFTGSPSFVHNWALNGGGDFQTLELVGDRVYAGCHCWSYHLKPDSAGALFSTIDPPAGDWTPVRSVIAYDAGTGDHLSDVSLDMSGAAGAWAIASDDRGCLWVGGDVTQSGERWLSGFGRWCDETTATDLEAPTPPKGLVVDRTTDEHTTIRWAASSDNLAVTGYEIFRSDDGSLGAKVGTASDTNFTSERPPDGTVWTFAVRAVDAAGNTSWRSNQLELTAADTNDTARPSPPKGLRQQSTQAAPPPDGDLLVELVWEPSQDNDAVASYQIHRSTNGTIGEVIATVTTSIYTDSIAERGLRYTYAVRAVDPAGNISWRSNYLTVQEAPDVGIDAERPSTPKGLRVEMVQGEPTLTWQHSTDNVGVETYKIFRSEDGTLGPEILNGVSGAVDLTTESGMTYTYAIKAVDAVGNTSWRSNLFPITIPD